MKKIIESSIIRRIILVIPFAINIILMLFPWFGYLNIKSVSGLVSLTAHPMSALFIFVAFFLGLVLFNKDHITCFGLTLISQIVLLILEIYEYTVYKKEMALVLSYVGIAMTVITIICVFLLLGKETFENKYKHDNRD